MNTRILVVDNEPDLLQLVTCHLQSAGYEVSTATNGMDALHQARIKLPDLILLDLIMDDMDGFTVCEILRCQSSTARIPVLLLTAMPGQLARINGLAAGAADYLSKPVNRADLLAHVQKVLEAADSKNAEEKSEEGSWMEQPLARLKMDPAEKS